MDSSLLKAALTRALVVTAAISLLASLWLLTETTQNSAEFDRSHAWLLLLNALGVVVLLALIGFQLFQLVIQYRAHVPGTRLTGRLVAMFSVLAAAAYEDVIRRMGSELASVEGRPKLSEVLEVLKREGVLKDAQFTIAQGYLKFRNDALHADWEKIEQPSIDSVLAFTERLILDHFS